MTDAMLVQARRRVEAHGWRNVSLIESDIAHHEFPAGMAGVISTFALTLVAECDAVIARARQPRSRPADVWSCSTSRSPSGRLSGS